MDQITHRNPNLPPSYQPLLKESIDRFLIEYQNGSPDFSNFTSIFSRLLQSNPNPCLEIIWFYTSLTKFTSLHNSDPVLSIKHVFQLLVSCSTSCSAVKKIALLAPVVYELYNVIVVDKKRFSKEVESLLEVVISYISICSSLEGRNDEDEFEELDSCFREMVRVWMVDKFRDDLRAFFPVVNEEVCGRIDAGCRVGYLAGVVMSEVFLLRLCLKFDAQVSRAELEGDIRSWVVTTVTGLSNPVFFGIILRMLLDPASPVASLLKFKDDVLLREVLCDALIMMQYPFLNPQNERKLWEEHFKEISVTLLLVAESAIRSARKNGDHNKVNSYMRALQESCLPSQLLEWVTCETGLRETSSRPDITTPAAFIKWLLIVEDLGVKVFTSDMLKLHARATVCLSRVEYDLPLFQRERDNLEEYNDDNDQEMVDMDIPSTLITSPTEVAANDGAKKRKDAVKDDTQIPVKYGKYQLHESVTRCRFFPLVNGDSLSRGNEVNNQFLEWIHDKTETQHAPAN